MDKNQPPKPVDPQLQKHMADLTEWFRERNLGGFVILCNGTNGEYKYMFDTTDWSCMTMTEKHMRFKSYRKDNPDKEKRAHDVHHTTDMIGTVQDVSGMAFMQCDRLIKMLKAGGVEIETNPVHTPGG